MAVETDHEHLSNLYIRAWRETYTGLIPDAVIEEVTAAAPQRWQDWLAAEGSRAWFAVDTRGDHAGEPVGFVAVEAAGPGAPRPLYLTALYVLGEYHGQGIGSVLLQHATGDAPCYLRVAERNAVALEFYQRHGFTISGEARHHPEWGIRDVLMVR